LSKLTPEGFLTLSQAADTLAVALHGGIPDRDAVRLLRERGYDLADGTAFDEAIRVLWAAVDRGKLQSFAVGPKAKVRSNCLQISRKQFRLYVARAGAH